MKRPSFLARSERLQAQVRNSAPFALAFLATMISIPGGAITIPDVPLQSGRAYPPPNVMFILDDSGSMEYQVMPTNHSGNLSNTLDHKAAVRNTIFYNPAITYNAWMGSDGNRLTTGTTWPTALSDLSLASGTATLSNSTQTYFYPKTPATATTATAIGDYYRYQILADGRVIRSETGRSNANKGLTDAGCGNNSNDNGYDATNDVYWRNCTEATPVIAPAARSAEAERNNYTTWYSYHRSRMKVAKAGASEAFSQVGENVRVGFDTIWNRNFYAIPVGTDAGLFNATNKTTWYQRLFAAEGSDGTPLKGALHRAGRYFSGLNTSVADPMGPTVNGSLLSCRQNFAILTTDGYWNDNSGYPSAQRVGDADGTNGATISGPNEADYRYTPQRPYMDNFSTTPNTQSNTLADVAMHYWKTDLRTDLENDVPKSDEDPAFWQHMVTFGVSIGQKGTLTPNATTLQAITNGSTRWPDPVNPDTESARRIDDLWHAAVNSRGDFIVASNTNEFAAGILTAINTVAERQGSASNVTANSTSFVSDTRVYQAKYVSGKWSGELSAYDATAAGVANTPAWNASTGIPAWGSRRIFTWTGSAGATFPTPDQLTALDRSTRPTGAATGQQNADYIKGDASRERKNTGGVLRNRDHALGDIVNSSPIYVKDTETLYVGANDGMLHAVSAINQGTGANRVLGGQELFAYVPGGVNMSNLASLSDPAYQHKYFVDGPIVVSARSQTPGKNYLVGALGRGGKGLFGLDVTDPRSFSTSSVRWEMTSGANMGYILGEPLIVTLNDGASTKAVIFGNGINSTSGVASLFVVNIATGALIQEISTGVAGDNGLSAPRGWDENGDGTVDYVYAGDMRGNLWKFDFTGSSGAIAFGGSPMFTTPGGQPISAGLALAREPLSGRRWVFLGTGRFMTLDDMEDSSVQSVYGLMDDGTTVTRSQLTERDIVVTGTVNGSAVRGFEAHSALPGTSRGWYIDLDEPTPGERVVSRPLMQGQVLTFSSIIPPIAEDPCDAGGSGYLNAVDAFSGTSTTNPFFDANGDGVVNHEDRLTTQNGDVPVGSFDPGVGMPTLPTTIDRLMVVGGSKGTLADLTVNPQMGAPRRVSWREVLQN